MPKKSTVPCLNDYRPITLTPIVMKCFERLIMRHIKTTLTRPLAITTTLHLALTHLDNKDSYIRMLFIDFNTIIPST
ncbi:hypothetical protein QTP70_001489 [Hemibagrus guttatus]|uniref:Uncharacterized protein n=1 Tax=Hemibagrus guttatus TaxID=175788 RepID=A0AAE0QD79_9TELE|nr:hypothetical protein QTP70_001489 [Hemibagrus guttatus]